jgi:hypothetical protein
MGGFLRRSNFKHRIICGGCARFLRAAQIFVKIAVLRVYQHKGTESPTGILALI